MELQQLKKAAKIIDTYTFIKHNSFCYDFVPDVPEHNVIEDKPDPTESQKEKKRIQETINRFVKKSKNKVH